MDEEARFADAVKRLEARGSSLLAQQLAELWFAHAYLAKLPSVHTLRVGVLGFEEGGDLALLLAAIDPEVTAVASIGGAESFAASAGRPMSATGRLVAPRLRGWGELAKVVPLVQPRPFLAVGSSPTRPSGWQAGAAWYGEHRMAERLAYVSDSSLRGGESHTSIERAAVWLTRWLNGPQ